MKSFKLLVVLAFGMVFAGCATTEAPKAAVAEKPAKSVEPALPETKGDPNAFADYGKAMASDKKLPMAVEWHNQNAAQLAQATEVEELRRLASSSEQLESLLAQVKSDYQSDPMAAIKIGAVSQIVMCRKWDQAPAARERWTTLLLKAAENAKDPYRKMFFLDQLRWCGKAEQSAKVLAIGKACGDVHVAEFAVMVAKEIR